MSYDRNGVQNQETDLRDYFAAKALAGFCANPAVNASNPRTGWGLVNCTEADICELAYHYADQMIAARKKSETKSSYSNQQEEA